MKLRRLIASLVSACVAASAMAVASFAAVGSVDTTNYMREGDTNGTVFVLADKEADPNWSVDTGISPTEVYGVTYHVEFGEEEWIGGGIGANSQSTGWKSIEWGTNAKTITADVENGTITWLNDAPVFAADDTYCQFWLQTWTGTCTIKSADILAADGSIIDVVAEEEAPAEDDAAADEETTEEAPAEDAEAEEETEEDAAEEEAAPSVDVEIGDGSFAGAKYLVNNEVGKATLFITAEEGSREPNLSGDTGFDQTSIYGVTFYVDFVEEEVADEATWIGGGIGANSNSTGWLQKEWGRTEKEFIADLENGTITMFGDAPIFAADDTYCQLWLQTWGGTVTVNDADLLDADGKIIEIDLAVEEETPVVEEDEAPATGDVDASTDSSKGSPDTGVEDVAVVAGLAIVAAGAVLVSKKRK